MHGHRVKGEEQNQHEGWEDSLDSAGVKVQVGEMAILGLFDDNLGNKVSGDDKENIDPDESSWKVFRKGVINDDKDNSDSPQSINVRPVYGCVCCMLWLRVCLDRLEVFCRHCMLG